MRVSELIDMLKDQPPDAEVELAIVAPVDDDSEDITVDRYSVEGMLPWEDDDDEGTRTRSSSGWSAARTTTSMRSSTRSSTPTRSSSSHGPTRPGTRDSALRTRRERVRALRETTFRQEASSTSSLLVARCDGLRYIESASSSRLPGSPGCAA